MKNSPIVRPEMVFQNLKLSFELLKERRVPFWLKAAAIGAGFMIIVFPDLPGPLDDAGFIYLVSYCFIRLCPQDVVKDLMSKKSDWFITASLILERVFGWLSLKYNFLVLTIETRGCLNYLLFLGMFLNRTYLNSALTKDWQSRNFENTTGINRNKFLLRNKK